MLKRLFALGAIACCICSGAEGQQHRELSEADQAQLQRDKILITSAEYRQIFTPYVGPREPVFITSDSALNAWHVLFEESLAVFEERFSLKVPGALDQALDGLKESSSPDSDLGRAALRRARIVLGTASRLAGGKWRGEPEVEAVIEEEVRRVEAAEGVFLPEWLKAENTPLVSIDYAVFQPMGFYVRNERMQRYFRAVRWLQTAPFDLKRDDNTLAAALISDALRDSRTLLKISDFFGKLIGPAEKADPFEIYSKDYPPVFDLAGWRRAAVPRADSPQTPGNEAAPESSFVALAARNVLELDLFHSTTGSSRPFPQSLEIGALLGSAVAEEALKNDPDVLKLVLEARKKLNRGSIYSSYLLCLSDLFAAAEPGAPDFMNSVPWQRKSLNTALAGWAQARHAFALQAKEDARYVGVYESMPKGFVEPNPEFFHRLAKLSTSCLNLFEEHGGLGVQQADIVIRAKDLQPRIRALIATYEATRNDSPEAGEELDRGLEAMRSETLFFWRDNFIRKSVHDMEADLQRIVDGAPLEEVIPASRFSRTPSLNKRWVDLVELLLELESISRSQMRGNELSPDDEEFIKTYGEKLAGVMFYDGNSFSSPRDNAPRVASVFNQPGKGFLMAGVGRPREIRVLYPWKGKEIECKGAVMPFLEMKSHRHFPDDEWKSILDGPARPAAPEPIRPLMAKPAAE